MFLSLFFLLVILPGIYCYADDTFLYYCIKPNCIDKLQKLKVCLENVKVVGKPRTSTFKLQPLQVHSHFRKCYLLQLRKQIDCLLLCTKISRFDIARIVIFKPKTDAFTAACPNVVESPLTGLNHIHQDFDVNKH